MIKILIGVVCLAALIKFPVVILSGIAMGMVIWIFSKKIREGGEKAAEEEYKPYTPYEGEVESMLKPGYKDDPEWQRLSKEVKAHIEGNRESAREELIKDMQAEIRRLRKELAQSERS